MLILGGVSGCKSPEPQLTAQDMSVLLTAQVTAAPPQITLSWPRVPMPEAQISVYRKSMAVASFSDHPQVTLAPASTSWVDHDVGTGLAYDYYVERVLRAVPWQTIGFLRAGIEMPLVEDRGQIALLIEERILAALPAEIGRLEEDLRGDGWSTVRVSVQLATSPPEVKEKLRALYLSAGDRLRQVLILGHVSVPYSGNLAPDGHSRPTKNDPVHRGAWPADVYYADFLGQWTDTEVDTRTNEFPPTDPANANIPGDGKFDQDLATTDRQPPRFGPRNLVPERRGTIALAVGRVDFSDLPAFRPRGEIDLVRDYLDKDHRFRHKQLLGQPAAVIDDHFGVLAQPGASATRADVKSVTAFEIASALFEPAALVQGGWFDLPAKRPVLFAYASGPGQQASCEGVGTTADLARKDPKVIFSIVYGSYFGDWDHRDNFLRAQIATSVGLASGWASSPWFLQPLGLGATIGECLLVTQNAAPFVHLALMGDPSLRMFVVAPPTGAVATAAGNGVTLGWKSSAEPVLGYHVYRGDPGTPVRRLTAELRKDTSFTDPGPVPAAARYLVRAVKLEVTPSGSFFNLSQAAFVDAPVRSRSARAPSTRPPPPRSD